MLFSNWLSWSDEAGSGMTASWRIRCWKLGLVSVLVVDGVLAQGGDRAKAQIVPDATLGAESSVVTPLDPDFPVDLIEGGATRGANLFHSFEQFSVLIGRGAYFNNALEIQNIISRVTGSSISNIDGLIGANGTANLFFLNPNGIIFGPNATLAIGGSFVGSTANSINFGDGISFSAPDPQAPSLLTVNVPLGLQFGGTAGSITNQTIGLQVQTRKTLALVGGNVSLAGGIVQAPGGRVELGGLAAAGTVGLNSDSSLSFPNGVARADVSLTEGALVNVAAGGGGDIAVNARNLNISGGSLYAGISPGFGTVGSQAGDIEINATDEVRIQGETNSPSVIGNVVGALDSTTALGNAGNVIVNTAFLEGIGNFGIGSFTFGQGNAGRVTITASDEVSFSGGGIGSGVASTVGSGAEGNGGGIEITTGSLSLTDGAELNSSTSGQGDAGSVLVQAEESVSLTDSDIFSTVESGAQGNGGLVNINAGSLSLRDGAQIQTSVRQATNGLAGGRRNAGSVNIDVRDTVMLAGSNDEGLPSAIFSSVGAGAEGNAGGIDITTGSLSLSNGAQLNSSTYGQGNAGSVLVQAEESVTLTNSSRIFNVVESGAEGDTGGIFIKAGSLSLTNGADVQSGLRGATEILRGGRGNSGSVNIDVRDAFTADGVSNDTSFHGVFNDVESGAEGNGGEINIKAKALSLTNGALLFTSARGQGDAGDVTITVSDTIIFDGVSSSNGFASGVASTVGSGAQGNAGRIDITAGSLSLTDGAELNSSTFGQGDAGSVLVQAEESVSLAGSAIFSTVESGAVGNGGLVNINAGSLSVTDGAQIQTLVRGASEELAGGRGNAGSVNIDIRDTVTLAGSNDEGLPSAIFSSVGAGSEGRGGNIMIAARSLSLGEGGGLNTATAGKAGENGRADAGNIRVNVSDSVAVSGGSQLRSDTFGEGDAGNVTIEGRDGVVPVVSFDGVAVLNGFPTSSAVASTVGRDPQLGLIGNSKGGDITIRARSLSLTDQAALFSSTSGKGDAGNISVQVDEAVSLTNESQIRGAVEFGGEGKGANITITARSLLVTNGSQVGALLFRQVGDIPGGQGQGGDIQVNASDFVTLSGIGSTGFSSGLLALTEREASGPAGNITVTTDNFRVADGAVVAASTFNSGDGGDITINTKTFEAVNGGQVLTNTRNSGNAGSIKLNATERIALSGSDPNFAARLAQIEQRLQSSGETDEVSDVVGNEGPASGLFANTAPGSTGYGGSIFIDPMQLTITDGAGIAVDSQGTGNGGSLQVQAGSLTLDRDAFLSAATASGKGGDITLQVQDLLLMRRNSNISTQASGTGNGGNIDIDADFLVAVPSEDSNIIANAIEGQGGNIDITAQGIFGIQYRDQQTSLSDITASSEVGIDGTVEINRPDVDPSQGLVTLPTELVEVSNQIAQGCAVGVDSIVRNEFIITGRGGLPPNPTEPLSGEAVLTNWATLEPDVENRSSAEETAPSSPRVSAPTTIVEAQGWVIGANGEVVLTATAPSVTPTIPGMTSSNCHTP